MAQRRVDYTQVTDDYHQHRQLKKGAAGWVLLAGLGVSYVISGDFAGWNFGLDEGGWGGLLIATVLMGVMYTCMVFGLAEMSSTLPTAGAGYGFARRALGPLGGYATGVAVLIEYAVAPAAIAVFIGGYVEALGLFGLTNSWPVYLVAYLIFIGLHVWGVGEALKIMFAITAIAVVALIVTVVGLAPHFDTANLFDIAVSDAAGASSFLPYGFAGALAALVYGIWFFLAVEGVPLAAEETADPKRDMPRGIIVAMGVLLVFAALMLLLVPGSAGAEAVRTSDNPLPEALRAVLGGDSWLAGFVNYAGLAGLVASFFSIIYAYSRQLFALSRAGYLPRFLSLTGSRKTPWVALLVPGTIGFLLAAVTQNGALLINIAVFGATVSYVLLNLSHIVLRRREPDLERGYRTPGGVATTGTALVLSLVAVVATFFVDPLAAGITAVVFVAFVAYFWFYSRHHLVASAPEEEFDQLTEAEGGLR
ncbi:MULTISPECIES: ethanolamine permease [unclassified Serinicoccus]|uniref:ethanolamine permease n=1 Tax=unclassified Serinicoccus TaxID=2643101 RepID=UPI003852FE09